MKEFVGLRTKAYSYLMDDDSEHKKAKGTKKCIIKRQLMFKNYADCLFNYKIVLKSQQRLKINCHSVYTEQINKIALSSNDDKYLTGKDILPSNQQQIIEQAKFTYSPLGKAFDKQIKTIEDQGKKQVDALNTLKSDNKIIIEKYIYDPKDTPFISKQKEIFNKLVDEKLEKITDLDEKVNNDDLIYKYKGKFADTKFDEFDNALGIINKIRDGKKDLAEIKNNQQDFKLYLGEIKKGAKKSKEQKNTIYNIEMLYKTRNEAIKFYDDY